MSNSADSHLSVSQNIGNSFKGIGLFDKKVGTPLFIICFVTFVASFDFSIFVFLADTLSLTFFSSSNNDQFSQQLKLISLFAVGFISRPIGALLFGKYGDKKGRKPVLRVSLSLLFSTSLIAALLPSYAQIGVVASVLLILVRLFQGAAFANQLGLSWVYISESLPRKHLSTYISMVCTSSALGVIGCGLMTAYLEAVFIPQQLTSFAWRIPFFISGLLGLAGYILVRHLDETKLFLKQVSRSTRNIEISSFSYNLNRLNALFLTTFLTLIYSSSMVLLILLLPKLINNQVSIDTSTLSILSTLGLVGLALGMLFYGWLADKLDLGRVFMIGSILLCIKTIILYYYLSHGIGTFLLPIYTFVGFGNGLISLCPMIFLQLFPTKIRLMSINFIFNVITVFTGVLLPFSLFYISDIISFAPAMYLLFMGVCAFFIGFYVHQTPQLLQYRKPEIAKSQTNLATHLI